ncbi:MAG: hypothetical protein ABIG84_07845 [archaeon]
MYAPSAKPVMFLYQLVIEEFDIETFVNPLALPHSRSDWFSGSEEVTLIKTQFAPVVALSESVGG